MTGSNKRYLPTSLMSQRARIRALNDFATRVTGIVYRLMIFLLTSWLRQCKLRFYRERVIFTVAGPVIWNSLPAALWTATLSPLTFARHSEGAPVRLIDSASEDHLWRALQIYLSSSSSLSLLSCGGRLSVCLSVWPSLCHKDHANNAIR